MSVDTVEIICPSCGTVSHFDELNRDAAAFCRGCDYPLFWARPPRAQGEDDDESDDGLRRLPGTVGRVSLATVDCPECTEPNQVSASVCVRCGADLHAAPPTLVVPEPQPEPEPEPEIEPEPPAERVIWPWIVLAVLAIAAVVVLVLLLA